MEEKQTYMSASSSLLLVSAENEVPRLSSVSSSVLHVEKAYLTWVKYNGTECICCKIILKVKQYINEIKATGILTCPYFCL